jgi:hypothetical protein|tara:strand:+ start:125 stop:337 length:213 start_codon:yes stop_codon:yes gene_type:complete
MLKQNHFVVCFHFVLFFIFLKNKTFLLPKSSWDISKKYLPAAKTFFLKLETVLIRFLIIWAFTAFYEPKV